MKQRHPHASPGSTGHSVSCPCHQLCWVRMGGTRPPAEEVQRRVVGDHRKVRRAAHASAAVSTGRRPTHKASGATRGHVQIVCACVRLCARLGASLCREGALPRCATMQNSAVWRVSLFCATPSTCFSTPCPVRVQCTFVCVCENQCAAGCHNVCPEGALPRCAPMQISARWRMTPLCATPQRTIWPCE